MRNSPVFLCCLNRYFTPSERREWRRDPLRPLRYVSTPHSPVSALPPLPRDHPFTIITIFLSRSSCSLCNSNPLPGYPGGGDCSYENISFVKKCESRFYLHFPPLFGEGGKSAYFRFADFLPMCFLSVDLRRKKKHHTLA